MPEALAEAAQIDGASHLTVLVKIMLPLSKPILSVLLLYYAVGHWNNYFWPMVLVPNPQYQPCLLYTSIPEQMQPKEQAGADEGSAVPLSLIHI